MNICGSSGKETSCHWTSDDATLKPEVKEFFRIKNPNGQMKLKTESLCTMKTDSMDELRGNNGYSETAREKPR